MDEILILEVGGTQVFLIKLKLFQLTVFSSSSFIFLLLLLSLLLPFLV